MTTKKEQQYQKRLEMAMNGLTFKEDIFDFFALVPSTTKSRKIYSVTIDTKWLYAQECTCPAGKQKHDCLHQVAVDTALAQYRPTFKQQCVGIVTSREVIDHLLLNIKEEPKVETYCCVVSQGETKFIPVSLTVYGVTSLHEGFQTSEAAYNWLEEYTSSSPAEQVAEVEEAKAESKMQAWNQAWEEQYSQDPRIEAAPAIQYRSEEESKKIMDAHRYLLQAGYEFRLYGKYEWWMPQYRVNGGEWINLSEQEMFDWKAQDIINIKQVEMASQLANKATIEDIAA